ncbi:unnamed protein product, partial [Larinioides sclopetarius]
IKQSLGRLFRRLETGTLFPDLKHAAPGCVRKQEKRRNKYFSIRKDSISFRNYKNSTIQVEEHWKISKGGIFFPIIIMAVILRIFAEFIRVLVTITRPYSDYVLDFLYRVFMGKTKKLPAISNKILLIPAVELAEKIRKKQLSCEEIMEAYVERAKSVHPFINAAVDERYEEAIKDAKEVDKFLASGVKSEEDIAKETPLLGVPFSCKESIGITGMKQTSGLVRSKDHVAKRDGGAAEMYRKAGAIPFIVTDVPELCMWWESSNHVNGLTKNPYDNTRTVGGSSGGEGAVITAASSIIGIGNDIAGSIRIPASFCGIYGHKPSRGIVPNWGVFPYCEMKTEKVDRTIDFVSTGPMCRYVQDLPLLLKALSGNDERLKLDTKVDFKKVKIYYIEEYPGMLNAAVPDVKKRIKTAVKHFSNEYGIQATPLICPELQYAFYIWESKLLEHDGPPFQFYLKGENGKINMWLELFKSIIRSSEHTLPAIYFGIVDRRKKDGYYQFCLDKYKAIERKFKEIFEEDAIILVPTHPEPPPHYLMTIPMYPNIAYTCIFNVLGYPSTQIPAGLSNGVPIGIQAISGPFKDHLSLATAAELDKVFNGWITPCPVSV